MKSRMQLRGSTAIVSKFYTSGVLVNTIKSSVSSASSLNQLQLSEGHPYHKIGKSGLPAFPDVLPEDIKIPSLVRSKTTHVKFRINGKRYRISIKVPKSASAGAISHYEKRLRQRMRAAVDLARIIAIRKLKLLGTDIGGPFRTASWDCIPAQWQFFDRTNPGLTTFQSCEGTCNASPFCIRAGSGNLITPSSDAQLDAYGTTGIARSIPTNPLVNMGQFIYELKDPPRTYYPHEWKDKASKFRGLASRGSDAYLNYEFGWRPFISDVLSFFQVTGQLNKVATQFDRDSGKNIHRKRVLIDTQSATTSVVGTGMAPFPSPTTVVSGGTLSKTITSVQKVWFSGCYTYYLPPIKGVVSFFERYQAFANHLYGLRLDPDLLWRVEPWSWALDWEFNVGDIIRNWTAFSHDGLVLRYGYVMETKTVYTSYTLDGYKMRSIPSPTLHDLIIQTVKSRRHATPYGFGLNPGSFTGKQNAIIGALGINRMSRWL